MGRTARILAAATVLAASLAVSGNGPAKAEEADYILATASTGGTYYPVGVAISTLVKVKLQPKQKIAMSAINSAGSGENVRLLRENEAQFAILQGLVRLLRTQPAPARCESEGPQEGITLGHHAVAKRRTLHR